MTLIHILLISFLPCLVIVAGLKDLTTMTIPNWISGLLILGFVPAAWVAGLTPMEMLVHLGVGVAALLVGMGLFAGRVIGGGDAKLMAVACLWLGGTASAMFALWTGLVGGLFCLVLIMARGHLQGLIPVSQPWFGHLMEPKGDIPYGVAIAAGVMIAFPISPIAVGLVALI